MESLINILFKLIARFDLMPVNEQANTKQECMEYVNDIPTDTTLATKKFPKLLVKTKAKLSNPFVKVFLAFLYIPSVRWIQNVLIGDNLDDPDDIEDYETLDHE